MGLQVLSKELNFKWKISIVSIMAEYSPKKIEKRRSKLIFECKLAIFLDKELLQSNRSMVENQMDVQMIVFYSFYSRNILSKTKKKGNTLNPEFDMISS